MVDAVETMIIWQCRLRETLVVLSFKQRRWVLEQIPTFVMLIRNKGTIFKRHICKAKGLLRCRAALKLDQFDSLDGFEISHLFEAILEIFRAFGMGLLLHTASQLQWILKEMKNDIGVQLFLKGCAQNIIALQAILLDI